MPGTAAPRYSPTKTHMHFQTDEEEEEVKKRVCEPGRPPQPSWRTGPPFTAHLVHAAAAAVCLRDRFGSAFSHFSKFWCNSFFRSFFFCLFFGLLPEPGSVHSLGAASAGAAPDRPTTKNRRPFPNVYPFPGNFISVENF